MGKFKLDVRSTVVIILLAIAVFSFSLFGMMGVKTIIGILLLLMVPVYFLLDRTSLPIGEKVMFSFILGVGFFPSIVYYLGFLIGVRKAIVVTFMALAVFGIGMNMFKKR